MNRDGMLRTIGAQIVIDEGNATRPMVRVNEYLDLTKSRIRIAQGSLLMMSDSFNQGMTSAGFFFSRADQSARENTIRQQYHNSILQQAAIKYDQMRTAVTGYADTAKTKIQEANKYIEQNRMEILGAGAALAGYGYLGGTFYSQGIKSMAEYQDAYATFSRNVKGDAPAMEAALKKASGVRWTTGYPERREPCAPHGRAAGPAGTDDENQPGDGPGNRSGCQYGVGLLRERCGQAVSPGS